MSPGADRLVQQTQVELEKEQLLAGAYSLAEQAREALQAEVARLKAERDAQLRAAKAQVVALLRVIDADMASAYEAGPDITDTPEYYAAKRWVETTP